jgi:NAD(P)-dependent dehydrogenase (short-subunit alcohol dehydrogenase family)
VTQEQTTTQNPLDKEPKPPFPAEHQQWPGIEKEMRPTPDFGEQSYKGYGRLKDKVALITGADSGIGRAVALAYAREGADVLISYYDEHVDAQETVRVVEESGRKAISVAGDIRDEQHCRQLVERTLQEFGHIDILVNNAAFQMSRKGIEDLPEDEWDRTFRTNIYAMYYLCKAAFPHMKPGSAIINTASIEAYQPEPSLLAYAATKGAIVTFTKALAKEAIQKGIRVNAVAPGPVWTPLIVSTMPEQQEKEFGKQDPEKRAAQPAELAPPYVFLALPEASYINAEVNAVTGGTPLS